MTPQKLAQINQMLARIGDSPIPVDKKLVIIGEIVRTSLPGESSLAARLFPDDGKGEAASNEEVDELIRVIHALLPLYETTDVFDAKERKVDLINSVKDSLMSSLFDLDQRLRTEVEQRLRDPARETALTGQIDDRVWRALNNKLTRSPWFQINIAAAAVAITLFSFGLIDLNKDVKHADEIVSAFQNKLAKADQDLAKDERESNARLNASVDNALARISQVQNDSMKGLNADLQKRILDVDTAKTDAETDIKKAVKRVSDQATLANPDIDNAKQIAIKEINAEHAKQLDSYRENAKTIIANLREPSMRNVLAQSFWLMLGSMVMSFTALIVSLWRR
jgi:uncharacterized protein YqfB (UPF0267 family)